MRPDGGFSFSTEAVAYIRRQLGFGQTLARQLLRRPDLGSGRVIALLTEGIEPRGPYSGGEWDFNSGAFGAPRPSAAEDLERAWRWLPGGQEDLGLADAIRAYLTGGTDRYGLFEDAARRAGDPGVHDSIARVIFVGEEVLHVVRAADDQETVLRAVKAADSWLSIGALAKLDPSEAFGEGGTATPEEVRRFADRADQIIVGAYDQEGYLVWNRR